MRRSALPAFFLPLILFLCLQTDCAVRNKPPAIRDGKEYGTTQGWIWRPTWWNYYERGVSFAEGGFWEEAMDDLGHAIDLRPGDSRVGRTYGMHFTEYFPHRELGVVYYRVGRYEEAERQLEESISEANSAKAEFFLNKARQARLRETGADRKPPRIEIDRPPGDTPLRDLSLILRGTARDDNFVSSVVVSNRKIPIFLAKPSVRFTTEVPLQPGLNRIEVRARDLVDRESVEVIEVRVDRAGPVLFMDPVKREAPGTPLHVVVSGEVQDAAGLRSVEIEGVSLERVSGRSHRFEQALVLRPGRELVRIRAEDIAGNVTHASLFAALPDLSRHGRPVLLALLQTESLRDTAPGFTAGRGSRTDPFFGPTHAAAERTALQTGNPGEQEAGGPVISFPDMPDEITVYYAGLYVEGRVTGADPVRSITLEGTELLDRQGRDVFFGYLAALEEGENRIRVEAVDTRGRRAVRSLKVTRKQPEILSLSSRMRLSLLPLRPGDSDPERVRLLDEDLLTAFVRQGRFSLVERERLAEVLRELRIVSGGLAGRKTAVRLGRIVSADGLVMGWAKETPGDIEVVATLIDVETSEILLTRDAYSEDKSPAALVSMMEGLAHRFRQGVPLVEGTVLRCERKQFYLDAGKEAGLKPGQKLILFRPGPPERHPVTGFYVGREMEILGNGRVEDVFDDASSARSTRIQGGEALRPSDLFVTK